MELTTCMLLLFSAFANATPFSAEVADTTVRVIHTFGKGEWSESLFVRPNGNVLVGQFIPAPKLFEVNPSNGEARLVTTFPNATSVLGITDSADESTYYVATATVDDRTFLGREGSNRIWEVNLGCYDDGKSVEKRVVANVSTAILLDGLATIDKQTGVLASTDFEAGVIYGINAITGLHWVILNNSVTAAPKGTQGGANGLKVQESALYFTNSGEEKMYRQSVNTMGYPIGEATIVASGFEGDDFALSAEGIAFVANGLNNTIVKVDTRAPGSLPVTAAKDIHGPTAARIAYSQDGASSIYVTTTGGNKQYSAGKFKYPGQLLHLDFGFSSVSSRLVN